VYTAEGSNMYNVEETAIKLNTSKQTIYVKMKLQQFKDKVVKNHGQNYISEDLLNLFKSSMKINGDEQDDVEFKGIDDTKKDELTVSQQYERLLNVNKKLMVTLNKQLEIKDAQALERDIQLKSKDNQLDIKDSQIADLNDRLKQEQDLHTHTQILFKNQQPQDKVLLEAHFQDLDVKLEEVKNKMSDRKDRSKGFFSKFFGSKD